ncbi:MAG: hypothetical protein HKL96_04855 [Phycisphaerales bacterium]|nr:hypothetical protein [Phycisphaerales bacterium]
MAAATTQPESYAHALHNLFAGAGGLFIFALLAFVIVHYVRRRARHGEEDHVFTGFTLGDLEKMRSSGEVTEDEYRRIKKKMAERWASKLS